MSGRVKIKSKDKDKKPKIDVFKVIENRFKNMNELRDLIDMDPRKGLVRIRDGAGFREGGGCPEGWEPAPFYWVSRVYDHSMSRTNRTEEVRRLYRVNVRPLLNSTIHPELELCSELDQ